MWLWCIKPPLCLQSSILSLFSAIFSITHFQQLNNLATDNTLYFRCLPKQIRIQVPSSRARSIFAVDSDCFQNQIIYSSMLQWQYKSLLTSPILSYLPRLELEVVWEANKLTNWAWSQVMPGLLGGLSACSCLPQQWLGHVFEGAFWPKLPIP